ncbi:MAG: sortase [Bacilli bacterium]|nr:sortase [Bacilli bacterium]
MVKRILISLIIIISISIPLSILKISTENNYHSNNQFAFLTINKINLKEELYPIESEENTIEKHVSILKESIYPDNENSIMILAAHSGIGKIAYFQELDKLEINDEVILNYKNNKYTYKVKDIWEEKKTGYINFNKEKNKQLILTTCSPNKDGYQLIINCIIKESN